MRFLYIVFKNGNKGLSKWVLYIRDLLFLFFYWIKVFNDWYFFIIYIFFKGEYLLKNNILKNILGIGNICIIIEYVLVYFKWINFILKFFMKFFIKVDIF